VETSPSQPRCKSIDQNRKDNDGIAPADGWKNAVGRHHDAVTHAGYDGDDDHDHMCKHYITHCTVWKYKQYTFVHRIQNDTLRLNDQRSTILKLENAAKIANALQLEAARRRAVPIRFNFVAHAKFELAQPIRCRLIEHTLRYAVTLNFDPVTLTFDLWPWIYAVDWLRDGQTLYEIWAKSDNSRRSYCSVKFDLMTLNICHVLRYAVG